MYLRLLFDGGITEYEDDSEYAPSGCVSFLPFTSPRVWSFLLSLWIPCGNAEENTNDLMMQIEERYFKRPAFEPLRCHEVL